MSIFNSILEKLGIHKPAVTPAPSSSAPAAVSYVPPSAAKPSPAAASGAAPTAAAASPAPTAIPVVDVMSKLNNLAGSGSGLDWKVSIVDLLKLLGIDSSLAARKELATELGCPADLMSDTAKMNPWLHKTVLQKIAENGGNIPQSLLH